MKKPSFITLALVLVLLVATQASATTRSVPGDYPNIQAAIDAAAPGDCVVIAPGTYTGSGNRCLDLGGKAITVRSTDPNDPDIVAATIIDCQGSGCGFYFHSAEASSSVVAGLTVTNGYDASRGGGVYCRDSSPTIRNCTFSENSASRGGGMYCSESSATLVSCTFSKNSASSGGGGIRCDDSCPTLVNCTFSENSASSRGGGMYLTWGSSPTLINCTFSNNSVTSYDGIGGGGMQISFACRPTLINCTFSGNTVNSGDGGGMHIGAWSAYSRTNPTLINCIFSGNIVNSGNGGGIYCDDSEIEYGTNSSSSTVTNCILWGNSAQQIYGAASVTYSDVQGGWAGEGNISNNPMFVNPSAGDYHLQAGSPCINAGDPNSVREPGETDIDGEPRIMGARVDMGVDEYTENIRPVADAGPDQSSSDIPPQVTLDGSGSSDSDGNPLSYHWSQKFGPEVEIDDANSAVTTFSPAGYGAYIFKLVVNDEFLDSFPDAVNIVVGSGDVPVADAGLPRYAGTDPVQLDGTGSYDPDNSGPLSYQWQQISGLAVNITDEDTATPTIGGFNLTDSLQICEFELIVNDGKCNSLPDTVRVVVVRDGYQTCPFRLESGTFDPEKPTFIAFLRGGSWNGGYTWESRANIMSSITDCFGPGIDYRYDGDFLITYLSRVAPDYKQPIQFVGCSGGVVTGMGTAAYLNRTYADPRYAINRVTFGDYGHDWPVIYDFLANPVAGEQCWIDNYMDEMTSGFPVRSFLNVEMLGFGHCDSVSWYKKSLTYSDLKQFTSPVAGPGVVAGAYWSVIGPGKNLQLASTYSFAWHGSKTSGYMDFDKPEYPGRLPEPVTLVEPNSDNIDEGVLLTCQESQNAVGYQLLVGADPYRVMDFDVISDTPGPPMEVITEVPKGAKYWTIKARDQWGSTIYADPLHLPWLLTVDLGTLAKYWLNSCSEPQWCDSCDINHSGLVDFIDFANFADNWLWQE